MRVGCFVALGDSFTAGTGPGAPRWPDEVAASLPGCRYANLAEPGARSTEVAERQLPRALELRPDLVSVICGANDVLLTTRPDLPAFFELFAAILARLGSEAPGARILTATYPEATRRFPLRPRSRERVTAGLREVNRTVRWLARRHGALCMDFAGHPGGERGDNFAEDGFHPSAAAHREAARIFGLGLREQLGIQLESQEAIA